MTPLPAKAPPVDLQRSRMIMAACDGLVAARLPSVGSQIRVDVKPQGAARWRASLFASDSAAGITAVASGEADLAIVNPSAVLTLAYRGGNRHFPDPLPLRAVTVMPQRDYVGLAVRADLGMRYLEEVAERQVPLRISWRARRPDHSIHLVLADILDAARCPAHAITSWGGQICHDDGLFPHQLRPGQRGRTDLVSAGERDAVFDEGVPGWWESAVGAGMQLLSLRPETIGKLTRLGYRAAVISGELHPGLAGDVATIDFSGWPVFTHADVPDELVRAFCEGIAANAGTIPWEADSVVMTAGTGPFPLAHVCQNPADAPLDVPYHPAARDYWRAQGYLD